jgi:hypothetical protein
MIEREAINARLEVIMDALDLPCSEYESAAHGGANGILSFAERHGQSLDWIVFGDVRPMLLRECKNRLMEPPMAWTR